MFTNSSSQNNNSIVTLSSRFITIIKQLVVHKFHGIRTMFAALSELWSARVVRPRPAVLYFIQFATLGAIGRFTALMLEKQYNLDEDHVGWIFGAGVVVSLIVVPIGGVYADTQVDGKRKTLFRGNLLSSLSWTLLLFTPETTESNFALVLIVYVLRTIFSSSFFPVLDGYTIEYLVDGVGHDNPAMDVSTRKSLFGGERLWGAVSWGITSMIVGVLLDVSDGNFHVMFVVLWVATLWMLWQLSLPLPLEVESGIEENLEDYRFDGEISSPVGEVFAKKTQETGSSNIASVDDLPGKQSVYEFLSVLANDTDSVIFLFTTIVMGCAMSLIENLVFLFFVKNLGASYSMCGFTVIITVIFEIPLFHYSEQLSKLGENKLMVISMLSYIARVAVYTVVDSHNMWLVLFVEPLHGVTISTMMLAKVHEMSSLAPKHLQATAQSTQKFFSSVGQVIGVVGGSHMMQTLGSRATYGTSMVVVTVTLVLYVSLRTRGGRVFSLRDNGRESSKEYELVNLVEPAVGDSTDEDMKVGGITDEDMKVVTNEDKEVGVSH